MPPELEKQHIEITPGICGGGPRIAGTRIRVQDIYIWHELQAKTPDAIVAEHPQITIADVYAALTYFWDHRDEIEKQLQAEESFVADMRSKLGPGPLDLTNTGEGGSAPVSS